MDKPALERAVTLLKDLEEDVHLDGGSFMLQAEALEEVRRALWNLENYESKESSKVSASFEELITGRGQLHLVEKLQEHLYRLEK